MAALPQGAPKPALLPGGVSPRDALARARQEREDVELALLRERLELVGSQRKLAAEHCAKFAAFLETALASSPSSSSAQQSGHSRGHASAGRRSRQSSLDFDALAARGDTCSAFARQSPRSALCQSSLEHPTGPSRNAPAAAATPPGRTERHRRRASIDFAHPLDSPQLSPAGFQSESGDNWPTHPAAGRPRMPTRPSLAPSQTCTTPAAPKTARRRASLDDDWRQSTAPRPAVDIFVADLSDSDSDGGSFLHLRHPPHPALCCSRTSTRMWSIGMSTPLPLEGDHF